MALFTTTRKEAAEAQAKRRSVTLAQRTFVSREGKAVADDDPARHSLLGGKGKKITPEQADAAGVPTGKLGEKAGGNGEEKPAAKAAAPAKNKQRAPAKNKAK